jgi:hypothetical protein
MKKLLITLIVQDGENRHRHRILHTTNGNDIHYAANRYAAQFYPEDEPEHLLSWWQFRAGSIAVEVENVIELSDYEYCLINRLFDGYGKMKPYFEIVQAGYNEGLDREEIQIHCGENGNMMIAKTPEGFVVDVYKQDDHVETMTVWEDDLSPVEIYIDPNIHGTKILEFLNTQGQSQREITAALGLHPAHNMSDEILMEDYFYLEGKKKWYPKSGNSMYTDFEAAIALYLQENRNDY